MSTVKVEPRQGFDHFNLRPALKRAISALGFTSPRPIQEETIPAALDGRDVLGLAQTGTGKTAAFAIPVLQHLLAQPRGGPRVLVVAPTRELALQIDSDFRNLAKNTKITTVTIYGGVSDRPQIRALRKRPEIVVACPGRLLDLLRQGVVSFELLETLILDEADHMFDMGFLPDIRRIIAALPERRQNLLFAATMPAEIRQLANEILQDPVVVELSHSRPAETIEHALYPVLEKRKFDLLRHFLEEDGFVSAIVFTRTKYRAKRLARRFEGSRHRAVALQGNMSQPQRDRAMQGFRGGRFDVLVATDLVARGIDVEQVSHVINFDAPNTPEAYTHRIGRTGRAERSGKAYTFVTSDDRNIVCAIERTIGAPIPRHTVEGFEKVDLTADQGPSRRRPGNYSGKGGGPRSGPQGGQRAPGRRRDGDRVGAKIHKHEPKGRSKRRRRPRGKS